MPLINCKINLILSWLQNCVISEENKLTTFEITNTKPYASKATFTLLN